MYMSQGLFFPAKGMWVTKSMKHIMNAPIFTFPQLIFLHLISAGDRLAWSISQPARALHPSRWQETTFCHRARKQCRSTYRHLQGAAWRWKQPPRGLLESCVAFWATEKNPWFRPSLTTSPRSSQVLLTVIGPITQHLQLAVCCDACTMFIELTTDFFMSSATATTTPDNSQLFCITANETNPIHNELN